MNRSLGWVRFIEFNRAPFLAGASVSDFYPVDLFGAWHSAVKILRSLLRRNPGGQPAPDSSTGAGIKCSAERDRNFARVSGARNSFDPHASKGKYLYSFGRTRRAVGGRSARRNHFCSANERNAVLRDLIFARLLAVLLFGLLYFLLGV